MQLVGVVQFLPLPIYHFVISFQLAKFCNLYAHPSAQLLLSKSI